MKRLTKNIINISVSVLLILALIFTGYFSTKNTSTVFNEVSDSENFKNGGMNGDNSNETLPSENDDSQSVTQGEIQEGTMPEIPSGETPSTGEIQEGTLPEIPTNEDGTLPEMSEDGLDNFIMGNQKDNTLFEVLLIIESIGLSLSLVYLFVSKFNLISFKDVFTNKDRLIIFILLAAIVALILSWASTSIVSNISSSATNIRNINSDFADKV